VLAAAAEWRVWWSSKVGPHEPLPTAAAQGFVLTTGQLADLGVTRSAARHALRVGRWTAAGRGVIAPVDVRCGGDHYAGARRRHAVTATAAVLRRPDLVVSGRSGAVLRGLPTLVLPDAPEVTVRADVRLGCRQPVHCFGAALEPYEIDDWFGAAVTGVGRTLVDLARHSRRDGIVAADAALHEALTSRDEIDAALAGAAGWPGVRQARAVLALADGRSESPLESLMRLALHDEGIPPPELQVEIVGYRVDAYWDAQRLVLEADGRGKYTDDELWREKVRQQRLRAAGCQVERVVWADLTRRNWPTTARRLWPYFRLPAVTSRLLWS
jgi:hypothetical protein